MRQGINIVRYHQLFKVVINNILFFSGEKRLFGNGEEATEDPDNSVKKVKKKKFKQKSSL